MSNSEVLLTEQLKTVNEFYNHFLEYLNSGRQFFEYNEEGANFYLKVERGDQNLKNEDGSQLKREAFKFQVFTNNLDKSFGKAIVLDRRTFEGLPEYSIDAAFHISPHLVPLCNSEFSNSYTFLVVDKYDSKEEFGSHLCLTFLGLQHFISKVRFFNKDSVKENNTKSGTQGKGFGKKLEGDRKNLSKK
jgi:hypothetical protein